MTGPLGAGKTTAIRHLLQQRPTGERWAVLINEWGDVGIDGALLGQEADLHLREIAGGCICCTSGPQLRVALDRLLAGRPHRILVEPSGLASPARLIDLLQQPAFAARARVGSVIALVHAAVFSDGSWRDDPVLYDQILAADCVVASRADQLAPEQQDAFLAAAAHLYPPRRHTACVEYGAIPLDWLTTQRDTAPPLPHLPRFHAPLHHEPPRASGLLLRRASHAGPVKACGWTAPPACDFTLHGTRAFFTALPEWAARHGGTLLRAKGVFRCGQSWWLFNWAANELQQEVVAWRHDSRWEILVHGGHPDWDALESLLPMRDRPTAEQAVADSHPAPPAATMGP